MWRRGKKAVFKADAHLLSSQSSVDLPAMWEFYFCRHCWRIFPILDDRFNLHRNHACSEDLHPPCGEPCSTPEECIIRVRVLTQEQNQSYFCRICGAESAALGAFGRHFNSHTTAARRSTWGWYYYLAQNVEMINGHCDDSYSD